MKWKQVFHNNLNSHVIIDFTLAQSIFDYLKDDFKASQIRVFYSGDSTFMWF